ncbi:MAG: LamG domain-containing protein [Methermicoccaceae archaeon]
MAGYQFDGVDDYIEVVDSASLRTSDPFTISVWAKIIDSADHRGLVSKTTTNKATPYDTYVGSGTNTMYFVIGSESGGSQIVTAAGKVIFNQWQFWTFVYDGVDQIIYLAGEEVARRTVDLPVADANTTLIIGTRDDFVTKMYGLINSVSIHNTALSQPAIRKLYEGRKLPTDFDSCVLYLPLYEHHTHDRSGYGNDGINHGARYVEAIA